MEFGDDHGKIETISPGKMAIGEYARKMELGNSRSTSEQSELTEAQLSVEQTDFAGLHTIQNLARD